MSVFKATRRQVCRQLTLCALLSALLVSATGASSCTAGEVRRQVIYPAIAVVVVLVAIVVAVSDVDAVPAAGPDYDCAVTNRAGQGFAFWDCGRRLGEIAAGETGCFTLGPGEHELYWLPLEYGRDFYDLRERVVMPAGRYCCRITLEPQ